MTTTPTTKQMITIVRPTKSNKKNYGQIAQYKQVYFSFLNKIGATTYSQIFDEWLCREFFPALVYLNKHPDKVHVSGKHYGMYIHKKFKLDENKTRLIMYSVKPNLENFKDNLHFLWEIEDKNGYSHTKILEETPKYFILEADVKWQKCCFSISLWSFLLKCLSYTALEKDKDNFYGFLTSLSNQGMENQTESAYLRQVTIPKLLKACSNVEKITEDLPHITGWKDLTGYDCPHTAHSNGGFKSILQYGNNCTVYGGNKITDNLEKIADE